MAWKLTVGGVDKTTSIDQKSGVTIDLQRNERGRARFTCSPGYIPALRSEVIIYDTDGVTPIFGGIIFTRATRGVGLLVFTEVECVDWLVYATWRHISYTFTGVVTLYQILDALVTGWLDDYGISIHPSQVTGPSIDATDYVLDYTPIDEILRLASQYFTGYTFSIDPQKRLLMTDSASAPAAPFTIVDAGSNVLSIDWEETSEEYATKVILRGGGSGTGELVQTWTVTAGDISNGYLQTDVPTTPTGGVSLTVNGIARTIGGSGNNYIWDWTTHRITAGTMGAVLADVFVLTYTAQYPFFSISDSGITPPIEISVEANDIPTKILGDAAALTLRGRYNQTIKKFDIVTITPGLRPDQILTINLTDRSTGSVTALVTDVTIELITDGFWKYRVKAQTGNYQTSTLDYFRGGGSSTSASFSGGVNITTIASAAMNIFLGGSRNNSVDEPTAAYTGVPNFVSYTALGSYTGVVRVELWAKNSGIGATARLYNVTTAASVGNSSTITSTTPTSTTFTVPIIVGNVYRLEVLSSANDEGVYCVGTVSSL